MNHGEGWNSGGRRDHRGRSQATWQKVNCKSPIDRGRGFRGGGRCTQSLSRRNNNSPVQVYFEKSKISNVGLVEKSAQQEVKSGDNTDVLQPSASSVSRECEDMKGGGMSCDLMTRMGDDSLSGQVSMSSTSDSKVEISSVIGNASDDSNTKLFDIYLERKGNELKPFFLELNREKRRAAKGYTGFVIRPGMVHLQNYLSFNDQVMIVKKFWELGLGEGGFYQPHFRDGASLHLKMMCLGKNWDPQTSRYGDTQPHDGSVPPKDSF
ncbi:unnamed protein product [Eruca vesicaria subsp. sativa]|uniref:Uncharacterized protein n=1 Tax=Eruca vesicaria subsp. sativa TaxID=29727 RepID=A0ABC8KJ71_ERUVS|nr:unnamed protein product [Eruca vesicaria subsp. sativa]